MDEKPVIRSDELDPAGINTATIKSAIPAALAQGIPEPVVSGRLSIPGILEGELQGLGSDLGDGTQHSYQGCSVPSRIEVYTLPRKARRCRK